MVLPRSQVSDGILAELDGLEALIRPLSPAELATPSRCAGWTVADVAAHVIGSMADVLAGRADGLGSPEVTEREVAERRGRSAAELADECAECRAGTAALLPLFDDAAWNGAAPGGYDGSLGEGVEALWYDTWLHADDIRAALGRPPQMDEGFASVRSHVEFELRKRGWHGAVPAVGDPRAFDFVLVATGRAGAGVWGDGAPIDIYAV